MQSIISIRQAIAKSKQFRSQGKRIVLVGGCFDILHIGHIRFLQKAKQKGDVLFVMLESDKRIHTTKGENRPIHAQTQRAEILAAIQDVDQVILLPYFTTDSEYDEVAKQIQPTIIATTKGDPFVKHKIRQAKLVRAQLMYVTTHIKKVSTSNILSQFLHDRTL